MVSGAGRRDLTSLIHHRNRTKSIVGRMDDGADLVNSRKKSNLALAAFLLIAALTGVFNCNGAGLNKSALLPALLLACLSSCLKSRVALWGRSCLTHFFFKINI